MAASDDAGRIGRWDQRTGAYQHLATATVPGEPKSPHLHASADGAFAAVVNDYGRFGEVLDLTTGRATLALDGGDYNEETVPFSLAFARHGDATVVVHRTDWNRLDVSDARTGELLTARPSDAPEHKLDYFHGALYLSPGGSRILDDGWIWHPVGFPAVWSLDRWRPAIRGNPRTGRAGWTCAAGSTTGTSRWSGSTRPGSPSRASASSPTLRRLTTTGAPASFCSSAATAPYSSGNTRTLGAEARPAASANGARSGS